MPIRFRCPNCETMLSIGRRKTGTMIVCPKCADQILVPAAEAEPHGIDLADEESTSAPRDPLADGSGTDAVLLKQSALPEVRFEKPDFTRPRPDAAGPASDDEVSAVNVALERGLQLSRGMVALLGGLVFALAGLAFVTGYFAGK